jgi:fermentation-respiration switch protein FrsA (DUF1100 family)
MVTVIRTLALTWLLACAGLLLFQEKLVWHPSEPPRRTPAGARLPWHDLKLKTSDGVEIEAWQIDADAPKGAVVYFHGNAGSIAGLIGFARELRRASWTTLLVEYRGYGNSGGTPSEEGTYRDAEAGYDALREAGFEAGRIVAWGQSLGGGVAVELARRKPLAALITESAFTSIPDVGAERFPFLPVRTLARIHYDNRAKAAEIKVPWLVIHGRSDTIVHFHHGEELFAAVQAGRRDDANPAPALFHPVAGGHEGCQFGSVPADTEVVTRFLDAAIATR